MKRISTLAELRIERKLLQLHVAFLELEIRKEFSELKSELSPLKIVTKNVGKLLSSPDNRLVGNSVGLLAESLVKNVFFKNSNFINRLIFSFLTKNAVSNLVEDHKLKILDWITKHIPNFLNKKAASM